MKRATKAESKPTYTAAISIHALVKRATKMLENIKSFLAISIHALVKRATVRKSEKLRFQSTPS